MKKNNSENIFCLYPKSINHKIILTKKDNIGICDLSSNCTELNFSISKNKFNLNKIFNKNENNYLENYNLENYNLENYTSVNSNVVLSQNILNYDIILFILIIILFITLKITKK